jgi:alkylation response protein AidB-like acyl-CoA dehydrogenase
MELALDADQSAMVDTVSSLLAAHSSTMRVRDSEPLGFDADLWNRLSDFGIVAMGVSEESGGGGASLTDLGLVLEQAGHFLASAPLVESIVTVRLLDRLGEAGAEMLATSLETGTPITLALHPAIDSTAINVPAGAVATLVVGMDGDVLVAIESPAPMEAKPNIGSSPIADRSLSASVGMRTVLATGDKARLEHQVALMEWKILTASLLVGLAERALEIGVDYAKTRQQFGVPIGAFQALAHSLADAATSTEGALLLAREAAWARDEAPDEAIVLSSMAFTFCAETAQQVSACSLHVHGGMGFAMETDIQLFFRRAQAWPQIWSGVRAEYLRLADAAFLPMGG